MNEYEARETWCPFARKLYADKDGSGAAFNRRHGQSPELVSPCIASDCMAWRWSAAKDTEGFLALVRERVAKGENYQKALSAALIEHRDTFERTEGYCGLAGQP